ncbi:PaaI family thioesterase [Amnibacterium sp. CER49]|uniref:PaaI family thioesterase n=1 Tax=Amnibacterium sp. CER49 TaxID=3039161 RepID=UPI0024481A11|nr:PaaI family thioesterase [Amnibacterium sp. CER49]MDH2445274.1 PaaI family thioesterase [Amnibacterium sp. CER49]
MTDERRLTVTWKDPREALPSLAAMQGIEYLRAVQRSEIAPPPIAEVFGMRFDTIEDGRFSVSCEPREAFFNPLGSVHGGLACTLLDTVLACAGHTTMPAGVGYTSIDLQVRYLRAVQPSAGRVTATGRVVKRGARVIFTDGELTDQAGTVYATATSSLLVLQPR